MSDNDDATDRDADAHLLVAALQELERADVPFAITMVRSDQAYLEGCAYLEKLHQATGNVLFLLEALCRLPEDRPPPPSVHEWLVTVASNLLFLASRAATQRMSKPDVMRQALAVLDLQVLEHDAFEEYNRITREDTVLREHQAMVARGEKSEAAAAALAKQLGVESRSIFNYLKAARARAEMLR